MKSADELFDPSRFKKRPRYTMVLHDVRKKLGISVNTYIVVDSIHKLSSSDPRFPYCIMSKADLGEFLGITDRTVFRCINEAEDLRLIDRHEAGLRASEKWVKMVEVYSINARD